ncbi:MAG TPA: phage holin family protein [Acidimicrobiales bacterium]|nr:phage holin family protein [Acidimicrobiales bacterium]
MATSDLQSGASYSQRAPASEKPLAELGSDLARQMTSLVHHEIELAKAEMSEKGKRAGMGAGMFGASGALTAFAFGCVTACFVAALQLAMPVWLAALIVAVAYLAAAGVLAWSGRRQIRRATPPVPEEAVESTKEDVEWLKTQAKSARP